METHSALPLYLQISELLAREIAAGHLLDGEKLPPERDMAARLGISVGTLRKALAELTRQGLLERRQGSGNYVSAKTTAQNIYAFFRIESLRGGGLPRATLLSVKRVRKPADLPRFGTSDEGHRIRRLRYLNDDPCVLEEIWLDGSYADHITPGDLSESLYLYYREELNLWIAHVEDSVTIGRVPDWKPEEFEPAIGADTGYFERIGYAQHNQRAEYSRNWFDTTKARYVARIR
ncbi:GntR family transcriptional regulator [Paracoccus methylarcula]|uniref:GntR family transcriptional regulator n=1 Tax=Paracoccus methylarcula TaxID=72022 RepID=A0A422QX91_9RHOB|nr:GntR family transcriptional regulator [Paracoccus methylarcula]RNF34588.1 GntR family transcriptional regulator [Paracoccus methylarcula]